MTTADTYKVQPVNVSLRGEVQPPGSKSITNRAFITAALARGKTHLTGVLHSRDTEVMVESLRKLGVQVEQDLYACTATITGCGGRPQLKPENGADQVELFLENSGTSIRFLTALVALAKGTCRLDGIERMRERPIEHLLEALRQLGVDCQSELETGCPPVLVKADGIQGGQVEIAGNLSSQYLSGLLMAAPAAKEKVEISIQGDLVSVPYVDMTLKVMKAFGVDCKTTETKKYVVSPQKYIGQNYHIEPDASAASYFFAAAAITGGRVTIHGLHRNSLQGDVRFAEVLEEMGCLVTWLPNSITVVGKPLQGIDIDMNDISDTAQTLAVVALFAEGPTSIRNVEHMRHKETDRVEAIAVEMQRMGIKVEVYPDGLTIYPGPVQPAVIETYDDHRMAMSFALVGLLHEGIQISDPGCTSKTYPHFFTDLEKLCNQSQL
ncbi:3-phosphoshikimate 1-carboxyvinyltransferase [Polystyrenella longa]|uniref:3-phosphoshikimate 1-carboxyvinyltransferase n=1 Tax=Polystyrenella longa TaxID=2528007 RepID=A0A518CQH3_9PLAN|nr:3-phosphoshikimate 1-carboxyvinyltransferase [Polystyrenella longa]QDU81465.1 3-phosphoshikimate 1-carboxyvinyltransferase [Polystyrenella longa]